MNETTTFVIYEHPLNEKVRSWLRLETLLSQIFALQHIDSYTSGIAFFRAVSELIEVLDRGEVRSELIKELDKQHQRLVAWSEAPYVDKEIIVGLLADVNTKQVKVKTAPQFAHQLRGDKIISMVRQRLSIPGGYCGFDLPLLQLWLNLPQPERDQRMSLWLDGLLPLKESLDVILLLIRNSGYFELIESHNGFYQDSVEDKYLLRIKLPVNELIYPQISGHKTRFAIRFLHFDSEHGIIPPILKFELASC